LQRKVPAGITARILGKTAHGRFLRCRGDRRRSRRLQRCDPPRQLGLKSACIDKRGSFGGTCLNIGCIPSKALLHASERFEEARKEFGKLGIRASVELDLPA
jgi:hypothetical protein